MITSLAEAPEEYASVIREELDSFTDTISCGRTCYTWEEAITDEGPTILVSDLSDATTFMVFTPLVSGSWLFQECPGARVTEHLTLAHALRVAKFALHRPCIPRR